jgi:Ca2+-binding EF-hand superfamily protein
VATLAAAGSGESQEESTMLIRTNQLRIIVAIAVLVATGTMLGTAAAQKAAVPKPQDRLAMGEDGVKQLLALMETDKKGMVSKQEFMKFMEAEFERLDKNKNGELNARQLTQSTLSVNRFVGK